MSDSPVTILRGQRLIRRPEVEDRVGLITATIYRLMRRGQFPKPIEIHGPQCVGWIESEIDEWIAAKIEAARGVA